MSLWMWVVIVLSSWFAVSVLAAAVIASAARFRRQMRAEIAATARRVRPALDPTSFSTPRR